MIRTWVAGPEETDAITRLLVAFRDHLGERKPPAEEMLASVERIIVEPDSEFLLASVDEATTALTATTAFFGLRGIRVAAGSCF